MSTLFSLLSNVNQSPFIDSKKFFGVSGAHFCSASQSHIYKSLEGLEKEDWAEAHIIQQEGKPNRKEFPATIDLNN